MPSGISGCHNNTILQDSYKFNNVEVPPCLHTEIKRQIFLRIQIGTSAE